MGEPMYRALPLLVVVGCALGQSQAAEPPAWVKWSNEGACQRDNGCRGELILNGTWRWQPTKDANEAPDEAAWFYRNVPGWLRQEFFVRDGENRVQTKWKNLQKVWEFLRNDEAFKNYVRDEIKAMQAE